MSDEIMRLIEDLRAQLRENTDATVRLGLELDKLEERQRWLMMRELRHDG